MGICDNDFCDSTIKLVVDFHSDDRRQQFENKIKKLGWEFKKDRFKAGQPKIICPNCLLYTSELEKKPIFIRPIKNSNKQHF